MNIYRLNDYMTETMRVLFLNYSWISMVSSSELVFNIVWVVLFLVAMYDFYLLILFFLPSDLHNHLRTDPFWGFKNEAITIAF